MKKYKIEKLVVLYIYKYNAEKNGMTLCNFKITTKRKLGNKHFNDSLAYVKALDGVVYPMDYKYSGFCALKAEPILTFLDIEEAKNIKKVTYFDIVSLEKEMWKAHFEPKEEKLMEAKDLF